MIPREDVMKILEAGAQAPSGSNSEPWEFKVKDNDIYIFSLPEKDHPVLNYRNRGTLLAHGALIENIAIASRPLGYEPNIILFPDLDNQKITAKITLRESSPKDEELSEYITLRCTNRKPQKLHPLSQEQKYYLSKDVDKFPQCNLKFIEGEKIKSIAKEFPYDVVFNLENKNLHQLFFKEIVWSENEEKEKKSGLYIKTMELKPPQQFILKLMSNWKTARFLNKTLKITKLIYNDLVKLYSSSGLIGAIAVPDNDVDFIYAGRLMENIWLRATKMNLGFQLVTGVLFFWQRINHEINDKIFSEEERKITNNAYQKISEILELNKGVIALAFRIGEAERPSAFSLKSPPRFI